MPIRDCRRLRTGVSPAGSKFREVRPWRTVVACPAHRSPGGAPQPRILKTLAYPGGKRTARSGPVCRGGSSVAFLWWTESTQVSTFSRGLVVWEHERE